MIGPDVGKGLLHGGVEPGGDEGVLKAIAVGVMVVDVVGGDEAYAQVTGQPHRFLHKIGITFQKIALKFDVYRAGPEPLHVVFEQDSGFSPATVQQEPG